MIPIVVNVTKEGKREMDLFSYEFEIQRIIRITGEINDTIADEIRAKIQYLDRKSNEDIVMYINSPGGRVTSGFAIMDAMNIAKSDIRTVCCGMAASMGAFLVACGTKKKRFIEPNAEMMIHQPLGGVYGQAAEIELAVGHIIKLKSKFNRILADKTGKTVEQISADTDRDYYLDAKEAVEYGMVDFMIE